MGAVVVASLSAAWGDVDTGIVGVGEVLAVYAVLHVCLGRKKTRHMDGLCFLRANSPYPVKYQTCRISQALFFNASYNRNSACSRLCCMACSPTLRNRMTVGAPP